MLVSCVQEKHPYKIHPNNLTAAHFRTPNGEIRVDFDPTTMIASLDNCGVEIVKKKVEKFKEAIEAKMKAGIDPFKEGYQFNWEDDMNQINFNRLRLAFEIFIGDEGRRLHAFVSDVVEDERNHS